MTPPRRPHVVVVGGGVSGLAAAWRLCRLRHDVDVTVLESSPDLGGKLRLGEVAGLTVDVGAESMLATRPEAVALARECGLGDDLVTPTDERPRLLVDGDLREMPTGLVMGVPTDLSALARSGVVSSRTLAQIPLDHVLPGRPVGDDVSLGEYVGRRLGPDLATHTEVAFRPIALRMSIPRKVSWELREILWLLERLKDAGLGSLLIHDVFERARQAGHRIIRLSYLDGNEGAARFYAAAGFTELHREHSGHGIPDSVWVVRELSQETS